MKQKLFITLILCLWLPAVYAAGNLHLLPWPQQVDWTRQTFSGKDISLSLAGKTEQMVTDWLQESTIKVNPTAKKTFRVTLVDSLPEVAINQHEAYKLQVSSQGISIEATTEQGVYWAIQTLRQLTEKKGGRSYITGCRITDWPAFRIRGLMQDVGRSYISMEELKREIAMLARYKINVFHWHLTENQSWRLESKLFPMINDSINTTRMPGKYYTLEEAKELVDFCKQHHVLLIPEFDMPGHSAAFIRTFRHDMQSPEGMKILKLLIEEICETFDVPYLHIGTDEVEFTNPQFVPEMVAFVRSKGKKVISWNPGWQYQPGEIDMTHLWSYRGKAQPGIPAIDSRFHYLNHFDTFADIRALYNSTVYNHTEGSHDIAGVILAIWHDRLVEPEENIIRENGLYPNMLAIADRSWRGGGYEYFDKEGTNLPSENSQAYISFAEFEKRMLWHKEHNFKGYPFAYVKQTNVKWRITDAFPNNGDLSSVFPPETELKDSYVYNGKTYGTGETIGAGVYLRHVWGNLIPSFYKDPQENHTAYAWTWVYSPKEQEAGAWIEFQNYGRSEMDLAPPQGQWDYKGSRVWLNDREILPPVWTATHKEKSNEIALGNENCVARDPIRVHLQKGWNKVFLKLPVGKFTLPEVRLNKWMFTFVFVTPDGEKAVDGLIYSPDLLPNALHPTAEGAEILAKTIYQELTGNYGGLQMPVTYSDNMVLQREKSLLISGTANAGQQVTVRIAGQKKETVTAPNGKWSVTLDPLQAGGPYELTVEASGATATQKLTYKNVLVGEVWLCSGQSNMAFRVDELTDSQRKELLDYARKQPQIRLFNRQPRWFTDAVEWNLSAMDSLNRLQYYHDTQWTTCDEQTADQFSAVAFAFGRMLSDSLQVPVGLILNAIGGSGTEAWIDRKTLEFDFTDILYDWTQNDFIQDWVRGRAMLNTKKSANKLQRHPYEPCYLYETGIEPLQQYPIKGVIWYQGESNAQNIETHERLFPLLVNSWRENWQEELPFYYVQLSSIDRPSWTWFRNSQRKMMETIPNCGMAVSSDRGDSLNVHPRYKREIGERLARWALNKTYGQPVIPSGPLYRSVEFKDAAAYISFDYAEGLHTSDGQPVRTFEIAEHDGLFVPAQAEIIRGKVKVWNDEITNPKLVRYGWQPFTRANLVNGEKLPASTFKTKIKNDIMINWSKLPDLPGMADTASLGVSAPFVGISNGKLLVAGGCNFPDKPVTEGGAKKYYSDIFALDLSAPAAEWKKAGNLPHPVAYGAAVTTPEGIVCIGGNNSDTFFPDVYLLSWNKTDEKADIRKLPSLPAPMDNLSATYIDNTVYVAGGNENTHPCNTFLSMKPATESNWNSLPGFPGAARVQPVLAAQKSEDGTRIYLTGGFQPIIGGITDAIVPTDMLSYHPASKTWRTGTKLPLFPNGDPRTLTGGCAVTYGDSSILLMGGVNYDCFFTAINRPRRMARAVDQFDTVGIDCLEKEAKEYMHHPVEWYKFNTALLQYNTFTKEWKERGNYKQLARAGAGAVLTGDSLIIVNGELKPGIRTPQVNCAQIK